MINYSENGNRSHNHRNDNTGSAVAVGVLLVLLGFIFILSNIGLIPWGLKHLLISWQMLLILIGIASFIRGNNTAGTIFVLIGTFFILPRLHSIWPGLSTVFGPSFTRNFWPIIVIIGGLALIVSSRNRNYRPHNSYNSQNNDRSNLGQSSSNGKTYNAAKSEDGYIKYSYVFGGADEVFMDPVFKGGSIKATFGGGSLDLRHTSLPEDAPVYLKIDAVFGGITVIVPENWNVEVHKSAIFGGFDDERRFRPSFTNPNQKLIIDVSCVFGGGELK